jgi:hypothetical protein
MELIVAEDSFLLARLEFLTDRFQHDYDGRNEDIVDFVMGYWSEQMRKEMEELTLTDHALFQQGRQEVGVTMAVRDILKGLTGIVKLDDLVGPIWNGDLTIRSLVPTVHSLDELEDVFFDAQASIYELEE